MTQTCETSQYMTLNRPRPLVALPVLISVPNLATSSRSPRPGTRRRRLRREVRVAGYALLALLPALMVFVAFAGDGLPTLAAGLAIKPGSASTEAAASRAAVISLEPLEPVISVRRDLDAPVVLPGYLLPADTSEESSDGRH